MSDPDKVGDRATNIDLDIPPPSKHILPAKSEDKLEIEKEEKEREAEEKAKLEPKDQAEAGAGGGGGRERKKRKKKKTRANKVTGFFRSLSRDRKKDREEKEDKTEDKAKVEEDPEEGDEKKDEAMADSQEKMPKLSKLKKKNEEDKESSKDQSDKSTDEKEENGETTKDKKEDKQSKTDEDKDSTEKPTNAKEEDETDSSAGLFDTLKNSIPSFFGGSKKGKDPEKGEEEKELLAENDAEINGKETESEEESEEDETDEDKKGDSGDEKKDPEKATSSDEEAKEKRKRSGFMESLRNVSTHVPVIFTRRPTDKVEDVEAGERKKLLRVDAEDEDQKTAQSPGGSKDAAGEKKTDQDDANEKVTIAKEKNETGQKDPEKGEGGINKGDTTTGGTKDDSAQESDRKKRLALCGIMTGLILLIVTIVLVAAFTPVGWNNASRLMAGGKFIETHTTCGPVQGLVDDVDQFSFLDIPYAVPVVGLQRFTHSRAATSLAECYEGKFLAHGQNATSKCWRKYPSGEINGEEDCLTLDVFTPNVVYNELMPVVVYIGGEDLYEDIEDELKPNSGLAKKQGVVFVNVNYRHGILGFASLQSLAKRTYPQTSGNYGLGDIISALQWIQLNIQHFGGHPSRVTLLGRHSGASLITALTASPKAKGLFAQAWVSNPAGEFANQTMKEADKHYQAIIEELNCGKDESSCLLDTASEELVRAEPNDWTRDPELPTRDEKLQSWLTIDKEILFESLLSYWETNQLSNIVPIVFGSNAQGVANENTLAQLAWNDTQAYIEYVDQLLSPFNETMGELALEHYNQTYANQNWLAYASMLSDLRMTCPMLSTARFASRNMVANVYAYVATLPRTSDLGDIADRTLDVEAIFDLLTTHDERVRQFSENMQSMFYQFVREGTLPQEKDLTLGMYEVSDKITTQRDYPSCQFWKSVSMVPQHAFKY